MSLRILVFGGRDFTDREAVYAALDHLHARRVITEIIEGGAPGADTLAGEWADARGVKRTTVHADWTTHRKAAGPIRNRAMAAMKPDGGVQFPGGRGTADMRSVLDAQGVATWEPMNGVHDLRTKADRTSSASER